MSTLIQHYLLITLAALQAALLAAKLTGSSDLPWWKTLSPTWAPVVAFSLLVVWHLPGSIRRAIAKRKGR